MGSNQLPRNRAASKLLQAWGFGYNVTKLCEHMCKRVPVYVCECVCICGHDMYKCVDVFCAHMRMWTCMCM